MAGPTDKSVDEPGKGPDAAADPAATRLSPLSLRAKTLLDDSKPPEGSAPPSTQRAARTVMEPPPAPRSAPAGSPGHPAGEPPFDPNVTRAYDGPPPDWGGPKTDALPADPSVTNRGDSADGSQASPLTGAQTAQSGELGGVSDQPASGAVTRVGPGSLADQRPGTEEATIGSRTVLSEVDAKVLAEAAKPRPVGFLESGTRVRGKTRYQLKYEIARGGLGRIWMAHDQHLGRDVAIKEMLPAGLESQGKIDRFLEEAQVTGQLEHPGIVPIYELATKADGSPFYTMKLLGGRTYHEAIKDYHQLPPNDPARPLRFNEMLRIFVGICNAMGFAHSRGVLHRDLKPLNVMLGDFGEAIVVDWGLAKIVGPAGSPAREGAEEPAGPEDPSLSQSSMAVRSTFRDEGSRTLQGAVLGTPKYMSPEQANGRINDLDARADIYSLGIILYEVLTGRNPFPGKNVSEIIKNVRRGEFDPPRKVKADVPLALEAVCRKAMALDPRDRYSSAQELGQEIARWQAQEPVTAYREPWWLRARRWARRHRTFCTASAVAVLLVVCGTGLWSWREGRRLGRVRAESHALVRAAGDAFQRGELVEARRQASIALSLLAGEAGIDDLKADAGEIHTRIVAQIQADQERQTALDRHDEFWRLRDEALFHMTLFTGPDVESNLEAAERNARQALALVGAESGADWPVLDSRFVAGSQRDKVAVGCCELLLVLADAVMYAPGDTETEAPDRASQALEILDRASRLAQTWRAFHVRRARLLDQVGQAQAAQEALGRARVAVPTTAVDCFLLADEHYKQGELDSAIEYFDRALRLDPSHFWAQYFMAVCYLGLDNPERALGYLTACVSQRPEFVWGNLLRGTAYARIGEFATAESDFEKAVQLAPAEYGVYVNRAEMRIRQKRYEDASQDLAKAISLQPDRYQAYSNLAVIHYERGEHPAALASLAEAIRRAPRAADAYRLRAHVHLALEQPDSALADIDQAIRVEAPGKRIRASDHFERGRILHRQKRVADAVEAYDRALAVDPEMADAHRLRGDALMGLGRNKEAVEAYNRYLGTTGDAYTLRQRAEERAKAGDPAGAISDYTRALELDPQSALARGRRGWAYLNQATRLALADFDEAIRLQPQSGDLYAGRGYARVLLGDHEGAVADAEAALRIGPASGDSRERLAIVYNAACIHAQAAGKLALSTQPLAAAALSASYRLRSVQLLRQALELVPPPHRAAFLKEQAAKDPGLEPIRNTPEFLELLGEVNASP